MRRILPFIFLAGILSACSTLDVFFATPVPYLPTETPLPSPTFAWFPPSETPTPLVLSTPLPTPDMRPGLGAVVLADDFSEASLWDTATSGDASAQITNKKLNLSVQNGIYMISLRHELVLSDFYAEMTARPGLCRGGDSYGLLVRANAVAYYRFILNCNGQASADRTSLQSHEVLQAPLPSGDVPLGAPGEVHMGVWAVGQELRLFLNGHYQFTITDANYASGTLGVFVNSAGSPATVVSFSDLTVWNVNYTPPTATPAPKP